MSVAPAAGRRLLCICWEFPPQITATGLRAGKLLGRLADEGWQLEVVTAADDACLPGHPKVSIRHVPQPTSRWRDRLRRLRQRKVIAWIDWLDERAAWVAPATAAAMKAIESHPPDAVVVFMMPYMAGLVGMELKRRTGLPLVMNFDDSPTCDDMHPHFPSRWHYRRVAAFENAAARSADAVVYVSERNMNRVSVRLPAGDRGKLHLVRFGADPAPLVEDVPNDPDRFRIVYIGGMSGWHALGSPSGQASLARRLLLWWDQLGRYELTKLDQLASSPVYVGRAVRQAIASNPALAGKISVEVHGNRNPEEDARRLLNAAEIGDVTEVYPPVSHDHAISLAASADLLLITLPARCDSSLGGRISAKTYEYLTTDRPILAAVPAGENADFLTGRPGVWIVAPADVDAMATVIAGLAGEKLAGRPARFDRTAEQAEVSYGARAEAFAAILEGVIG